MRCSLGNNLADFGFAFLEKIHEPIFLVNRLGKVLKINEAGRKLLKIAHIKTSDLDQFVSKALTELFKPSKHRYKRLKVGKRGLYLVARVMGDAEFALVEVKH